MQRLRLRIAHLETENARLREVERVARDLCDALTLEGEAPTEVAATRAEVAAKLHDLDTLRNQHALRSYLTLLTAVRALVHSLPTCRACEGPATFYAAGTGACDLHAPKGWAAYAHAEALRRTLALLDNL